MNLFKQRATTIALGIGVLVCAHVGVSHGEANGGSRDRSGWQIGTPIITYYHGPGGASGRWGPLTPGMAKKLVDGGFTAAWGSAVKDLDVAHAHGLRVRLEVGDLMHHGQEVSRTAISVSATSEGGTRQSFGAERVWQRTLTPALSSGGKNCWQQVNKSSAPGTAGAYGEGAYEVDPLCWPQFGGEMKVVAFIESPQGEVIEKILKHCGLWQASAPRAPPDMDDLVLELDAAYSASSLSCTDQAAEPQDLTCVDIDTFLTGF